MMNTASVVPEEHHFIASSLSPGRVQRRLALGVVLAMLVAFLIGSSGNRVGDLGRS
jgi:hypothetical protein